MLANASAAVTATRYRYVGGERIFVLVCLGWIQRKGIREVNQKSGKRDMKKKKKEKGLQKTRQQKRGEEDTKGG